MSKPERIVHVGLGAFFKAHQAWYTFHSADSSDWGIVAYTGRSSKAALELAASGGRYHLITRSSAGDEIEVIDSIVRAESAENVEDFVETVSHDEIALVTLTITEAGYLPDSTELSNSALGRLVLALEGRRLAGGAPITLVPCDNMPDNGKVLRRALLRLAEQIGKGLVDYIESQVSFVSTSVDRITPKAEPADQQTLISANLEADPALVVTEPFHDWVLEGSFPLGRPLWETAGAKFVTNLEPFENRKLWLLNGAHTLLAFHGQLAGYATVDAAIRDSEILEMVEAFWDEAANHLTHPGLEIGLYRAALLERFRNPRIGYRLSQIAQESTSKLAVRILPVVLAENAAGRTGEAALRAISGWIGWLTLGGTVADARLSEIQQAIAEADNQVALLKLVAPELSKKTEVVEILTHQLSNITTRHKKWQSIANAAKM